MKEKKVILFLVEGPSDSLSFQSILEHYFTESSIIIKVMHGDITTRKGVNPNEIKEVISQEIEDYCRRNGYRFLGAKKKEDIDIKLIVHLIDTDGFYVDSNHIVEKNISKIEYSESEIFTANKSKIEERNDKKKAIVNKLYSMNKLNNTPYKVFYFSRNLEHVLHNRVDDVSDIEKKELAQDFEDLYYNDLEGFLDFIKNSTFTVPGDYKQTWDFIKKDQNSLKRYSNFHLLFQ